MSRMTLVRNLTIAGSLACTLAAADAHAQGHARRYGMVSPRPGVGPIAAPEAIVEKPIAEGNDAKCGVATYCGGPVISAAEIVTVYWTNKVSTAIQDWAPGYSSTLVSSTFMDQLSEYSTVGKTGTVCSSSDGKGGTYYFGPTKAQTTGQTVTRGTAVAKTYTITPTVTTGTDITDDSAAIGVELAAQIKAGNLPQPTYDAQGYPNTIYFVYFPSTYTISLQGNGSCSYFLGYHQSVTYPDASSSCTGSYLPYAVIPDCVGSNSTADLAETVSHELAEAVSDTDVGPTNANPNNSDGAWYLGPDYAGSNAPASCGEIGDVCANLNPASATVPGTTITAQKIWSQAQNGGKGGCYISNASLGVQTAVAGSSTCGGTGSTDAGADSGVGADSGASEDAGALSYDSGVGTVGVDSGAVGDGDAGGGDNGDSGGSSQASGCNAGPNGSSGGLGVLLTAVGFALLRRSRRR